MHVSPFFVAHVYALGAPAGGGGSNRAGRAHFAYYVRAAAAVLGQHHRHSGHFERGRLSIIHGFLEIGK